MLDLPNWGQWESLGEQVRAALLQLHPGFADSKIGVQVYLGYEHALAEIVQALVQMFPHRKSVAYAQHSDPAFEPIAVQLSKDGLTVKALAEGDLLDTGWVAPLVKDLLMVLAASDHPVTAAHRSLGVLGDALKDKRVFRIGILHYEHRSREIKPPEPYQIKILTLKRGLAVALLGERARLTPQIAPRLAYPTLPVESIMEWLRPISSEQQTTQRKWIEEIERTLPAGFVSLVGGSARLWDRVVLASEEFDGESVAMAWQKKWRTGSGPASTDVGSSVSGVLALADEEVSSTSLCRWGNPRLFEWYLPELAALVGGDPTGKASGAEVSADPTEVGVSLARAQRLLRGGFVLSVQALMAHHRSPADFLQQIPLVASEIRAIQNGY